MGSQGTQGMKRSFMGRGPKGYKRSDERVREDICDRLTQHDEIDATEIEITVSNGEVTLQGTVESRPMKHTVENLIDSVQGVQEVHNQLRVKRSGQEAGAGEDKEKGAQGQSGTSMQGHSSSLSTTSSQGQQVGQGKTSGQESKPEQKGQEGGKAQGSDATRRNSAS
jgi:hypothetical protein